MGESFRVSCESEKKAYHNYIDEMFNKHKYLTFDAPRVGESRSIGQNALFHVWVLEYGSRLIKCGAQEFTRGMIDGTKKTLKGLYYREYPESTPWILHNVRSVITGQEKKDFTSSATWKQGEMFHFLTWFQNFAAMQGIILESKGKFKSLQIEQNK